MAGSENWSGPALNALCISQTPIAPAPTSAYGAQVVNIAPTPFEPRICRVCLVSASWTPKTRPAPVPVSIARTLPECRRPWYTTPNASAAMTAAAGQCATEPNDSPMGLADRDAESSATPVHSTAAPRNSRTRSVAPAIGTARTRAKTRFVVSSGSTNDSDRCPIDQADSTWPPTMQAMPASQRGWRSRSVSSRTDRNREAGSRWALCCCSTKPVPISSAASSVSA